MHRKVKKIFHPKEVMEGAGVRLHRCFGYAELPLFDPFLLLDDFGSDNPNDYLAGFPWHPHRGIETITYIMKGDVEHRDSMGNKGSIKDGDVQWMTAGSGIIHQEMPQAVEGKSQGFQLWVNLPKKDKMMPPRYRGITAHEIPVVKEDDAEVKVIAGMYAGTLGSVTNLVVDVIYIDVTVKPRKFFSYTVPKHYTAFLYVFQGLVKVGDSLASVAPSVILTETQSGTIQVSAGEGGARFLLVAGEPLGEPIAWGGPMVMNTQEELQEAFVAYQNGTLVKK